MRYETLAAVLGLGLVFSPIQSGAETVQPASPRQHGAADPFEHALKQMESVIVRLRTTADPTQRYQLLREQARILRQAMHLVGAMGPAGSRPAPASVPNMPRQPVWDRRQSVRGPSQQQAPNQARMPAAPRFQRRQGAPYMEMEQQLALTQQRLDEQQRILDEILKYKEPFERLLQEQGLGQ